MSVFRKARIQLTLWYTLILMIVSLSLSSIYYVRTTHMLEIEYERIENRIKRDDLPEFPMPPPKNFPRKLEVLEDDFSGVTQFLQRQLFFTNAFVFLLGLSASYFLSGKTLRPIRISLQQQEQFVADAAHELKTPLTALKTSLEVSLLDNTLPKNAQKVLTDNLEDVASLIGLTENLLVLARGNEATVPYEFTQVDLHKVIERSLKHIRPLAKNKKIMIDFKTTGKDCKTLGNETALMEVMLILLDNAVKYSEKSSQVEIVLERKNKQVQVSLRDFGAGISKESLPHIFERFYRGDLSRTKQKVAGYGLGLSVAQKIMHQHNGSVQVLSTLGKGTTFTLLFS